VVLTLLSPRETLVLVNIDNIPYLQKPAQVTESRDPAFEHVSHNSQVEIRNTHAIAFYINHYLKDEEVFYVEFFNNDAVNNAVASDFISPTWMKRIQQGKTKIAFHNIHEGFHNISSGVLKFCIRHDIPTEHCIIISSNHDIKFYCERACARLQVPMPRLLQCEVFEIQAGRLLNYFCSDEMLGSLEKFNNLTRNPGDVTHHYLNLNRRQRAHRPMLVGALVAKDLHLKGKVSIGVSDFEENLEEILNGIPGYWQECPDIRTLIMQTRQKYSDLVPMHLDTNDLVTNRALSKVSDCELYRTTMLSVVSETTFFSHHSLSNTRSWEPGVFLSEKTWKPIIHLQPWIMVSQPFTQEAIRAKGYHTWGDFIDESYDYEESDTHRMYMVLRLIEQICRWTPERMLEFQRATYDMCLENQERLIEKTNTGDYLTEL